MTDLQTSQALLSALARASVRPMTKAEMEKQRVSFIMGTLSQDSPMTREQVQGVLSRQPGKRRA